MKLMNILFAGRSRLTSFGGIQTFVRNLLTFFASQNIASSYLEIPRIYAEPYTLYSAGTSGYCSRQLSSALTISNIFEEISPSLIHSHNLHTPFRVPVREVELAALRVGLPHVLTVHDVTNSETALSALKALTSTTICTQSQSNRRLLTSLLGLSNVLWLPLGISFDYWTPEPMPTESMFACPCRLTPGKGIEGAIALLGFASEQLGPISLCLSDPSKQSFGQTGEFLSYLAELSTRYSNLKVTFNSSSDSREIYRRCVATLVLPTMIEGFNLVGLESLAMGRPVLARPTGGMVEWMTGQGGVLILKEKIDPQYFTSQLKQMLDNRQEWYSKALTSRADLAQRYDIQVAGTAHCLLYRHLLDLLDH